MKIIKGNELAGKTFEVLDDGTLKLLEKGEYQPKKGDVYYHYIPCANYIHKNVWNGGVSDRYYADQRLVFKTKEEARKCKRYYESLDKYAIKAKDCMDRNDGFYYIFYDKTRSELDINSVLNTRIPTRYYFKSAEIAMQFIREAGKHNIMLHMFDVWVDCDD